LTMKGGAEHKNANHNCCDNFQRICFHIH
jgi:hypothetical protein